MPTKAEIKKSVKQAFHKAVAESEEFQEWKSWRQKQEEVGKLKPPKLGYVHAYLTDIGKFAPLEAKKWQEKVNAYDLLAIDYPTVSKEMIPKVVKPEGIPLEQISNIFKAKPVKVKVKPAPPAPPVKPAPPVPPVKPAPPAPPVKPTEISPSDEVIDLILSKYSVTPVEKETSVSEVKEGKEFTKEELAMCKVLRIIDPDGKEITYIEPTMEQIENLQTFASKGLISSSVCDESYADFTDCSKPDLKTIDVPVYFKIAGAKTKPSPKASKEIETKTAGKPGVPEVTPPKAKKPKKCYVTYITTITPDELKPEKITTWEQYHLLHNNCNKEYVGTTEQIMTGVEPGEKTPVAFYDSEKTMFPGATTIVSGITVPKKGIIGMLKTDSVSRRRIKEFEGKCKFVPLLLEGQQFKQTYKGYSVCDDAFYSLSKPVDIGVTYKEFGGKIWRYGKVKAKLEMKLNTKLFLSASPNAMETVAEMLKPKKKVYSGLGALFG